MVVENNNDGKRWEYRVTAEDNLYSLLERIRETPGTELLLDITDNDLLRTDGSLRRTLVSAASEFHKHLAFSFVEKQDMKQVSRPLKTTVKKEEKNIKKEEHTVKKPVPIAVINNKEKDASVAFLLPQLGHSGKRIAIVFSFLTGLLLAAVFFFLLPQAKIKITPEVEPVNMDFKIIASSTETQMDVQNARVTARLVTQEKDVSGVFPVKHMDQQGEKASGQVVIINKTGSTQKIKGKSRLKAENEMIFTMNEAAVVPAKGSLKVKVTADSGGEKGNLKSGKLFFVALPKDAEAILYAEVQDQLSGGTDKLVASLDKTDIDNSSKELIKVEEDKLRRQVEAEQAKGMLKDSKLVQVSIVDPKTNEELGSPVVEFHMQGKAKAELLAIAESDLFSLVNQIVAARVGSGKILGRNLNTNDIKVEKVDWDKGEAELSIHLENIVHSDLDIPNLKKKLMGRTIDGVQEYVRALPGIKDVYVELSPFWIKRVPSISRNIRIDLVLP